MEELIAKIIDIEAQAQEIVKAAKTAKKNLEADIEKDTEELHSDIEHKAAAKTETIHQLEDSLAEEKIGAIRKKTKADIEALEKKYSELKSGWVDRIVSNIIG